MIGVRLAVAAAAALFPLAAPAQPYPAKTVRILVGFAPGGGTDIMARAVGAKMTESVKQQFVIENRPGANANLAAKLAAEAPGGRLHDTVHVGGAHHEQARVQEPRLRHRARLRADHRRLGGVERLRRPPLAAREDGQGADRARAKASPAS